MKSILFLLLLSVPVLGQVAKKPVTEADYKLWSTLALERLSDKGNWANYSVHYESGQDTLFVRHTKTLKTYVFAGGTDGRFGKEDFFVCRGTDGSLVWTDLKKGNQHTYSDVGTYSIAMDGRMLTVLKNGKGNSGDLLLIGADGKRLLTVPNVALYSLNPEFDKLACDTEGKLHLIDLKQLQYDIFVDGNESGYQQIAWQRNGTSFTYLTYGANSTVGYYRLKEKKLYKFDRNRFSDFPKEGEIYNASVTELSISDDGKRVFFGIKEKETAVESGGVQLWNTSDKILYPARAELKSWTVRPKLAVWFVEEQKFRMVTDANFPCQELLPGQELALLHNPLTHEPQFEYDAPIDYYLQEIATGQQRRLLSNFSADQNKIRISNLGKLVAYFKDRQWWIYDIKSDKHINLTSQTTQAFTEEKYDRSGEPKVSGIAGWSDNDRELLVYDNYDIWMMKTDGTSVVCLTNGREEKTVYRIVPKCENGSTSPIGNRALNLKEGLLLKAVNDSKSGYFTLNTSKGLRPIVFENNRIENIKSTANGMYCYLRENYHLAPQLLIQPKDSKAKIIYQSNPQQQNYQWGFSKLITYENSKGQLLNGALFYPAGFDGDKSYPMVVYIYERLSDFHNQYVNPSLRNEEGFNISNLTSQGYFVLLPDIAYQAGETGKSALDCVNAAIDEVLTHESVNPKRVGLIGHSFGGYEVDFIVTQTNRFAGAISGSGMSDIISSYLTVCRNNNKPNAWRYEFNQSRMGVSLFNDYKMYVENSPITFVNQVNTPVLLWSGDADKQVDYSQSLEFHLALRRLQKPNILLLYEGERHTIRNSKHQMDLTHRTQEWFGYYLKGESKPEWFTPDWL